MGKASRFIKALFTFKPPESPHPPPSSSDVDKPTKRRWSFFKSHRDKPHHHISALSDPSITCHTPLHHHHHSSDHAIAFAAATAAADAAAADAVAAAHAAAEAVRMTTRTTVAGDDHRRSGEWAAVRIQSYFRGYLARKALRALKSLVRLQALVRGHIQRKQTAHDLRRMQAVVRTQARLRASRFQITDSPQSTAKGPPTPEKFEHRLTRHNKPSMLKNNRSNLYDERNEKILDVDNTRRHLRRRNLFQPDQISYSQSLTTSRGSTVHPLGLSPNGSCEVTSLSVPFRCDPHDIEEQVSLYTAHNSPPFYAVSSKKVGPFTPAKSDSSRSCHSGYSDHPNYMAYTESSLAKVRSLSAPRQRPHFEFPNNTKRYSVYGYGSGAQRGSNMRDSFASKAYPGSGRLDRLGMPVGIGYRESEFSGGYWN